MRPAKSFPSDPSTPGNAQDCADHSQSHSTARASSSDARAISQSKFDKLGRGNSTTSAIERARGAFLCARTQYGRNRALRRLEELGVGPPSKAKT
jgi:hypothetical protein